MLYREPQDDGARLITLAISRDRLPQEDEELRELYDRLGVARAREIARLNKAEPAIGLGLAEVMGDAFDTDWSAEVTRNAARVSALFDTVEEVVESLEDAGCPTMVVESAGVVLQSRGAEAALCSHDVDMLTTPEHVGGISEVMVRLGFSPRQRRDHRMPLVEWGRPDDEGKTVWINIGHEAFERLWTPLPYSNRNAVWLERRVRSKRRPRLYVPAPADALAHVAMHTSFHSFVRSPGLRLHTDVDRLVRDNEIDWQWFVDEIHAMGIETRAFVSLSMAAGLLGAPVPSRVLAALYPGALRWSAIAALLSRAGTVDDGGPKLGRLETPLLDALLSEEGVGGWLRTTVFPPRGWMVERYSGASSSGDLPLWRLHLERYRALATRWRPG